MICLAEEMYKALVSSIAIIRNRENKALESSINQENHQVKFYSASVSSTRVSRNTEQKAPLSSTTLRRN